MSILAWIVLGLVAGWIASMLVNRRGSGLVRDLLLGVVGAFLGGFLFTQFGHAGVTGLNLYSILVATLGAVALLVIFHAFDRRRGLF
ncbi:MAG: GlsB/YeaQ/YmgE family stress response membrane protein [Proteobacteria bacterium]|nr:GlsB/YeaQ/YmgE family stress response membrane protein [Pseudomonadota bacterium]